MGSAVGWQIGDLGLQVLDLEMGVALGGRHPGVAQEFLYRPQIGPDLNSTTPPGGPTTGPWQRSTKALPGRRLISGFAPIYNCRRGR